MLILIGIYVIIVKFRKIIAFSDIFFLSWGGGQKSKIWPRAPTEPDVHAHNKNNYTKGLYLTESAFRLPDLK